MSNGFAEWGHNVSFWAAFAAWVIAQLTKMLCNLVKSHNIDLSYLVSTGGMPSAHSATVSSLATAVGLEAGFGSPVFSVATAFALIVMFDASTFRRAAGIQARIMNQMITELFKHHRFAEEKLVELLGHTRLEVLMGLIMGVLVALQVYALYH